MAGRMKKTGWIYLSGLYGALWGSLLPITGFCFIFFASISLINGQSRGHVFLAILFAAIGAFLECFCFRLRDRFYLWIKFGEEGLFLRGLFQKKYYQRYDRYKDAGVCEYLHGDADDPEVRRLAWIYLTTEPMRPLYVRNIYRMPVGPGGIRVPFTEGIYDHLVEVLPGGLSDRLRMSNAKRMKKYE